MEIVDGIHRVDSASSNMAHSNVYLVINGSELIVIDTGTTGNAKKTVEYIGKLGYQPTDVSTIILTHFHMDHAGSAKDLKELTGAKIAVQTDDACYVDGSKPYLRPKSALIRVASTFIKLSPVAVEIQLKDGDKIGNLSVIHIPGHSPGSIALLDNQRKALFVGDTLRFEGGKVVRAPKMYTWNEELELASIKKIASLNFDVMLPGHGDVLTSNASAAVKSLAETLKL